MHKSPSREIRYGRQSLRLPAMKNFPLQNSTSHLKNLHFGDILEGEWRQIHLLQSSVNVSMLNRRSEVCHSAQSWFWISFGENSGSVFAEKLRLNYNSQCQDKQLSLQLWLSVLILPYGILCMSSFPLPLAATKKGFTAKKRILFPFLLYVLMWH